MLSKLVKAGDKLEIYKVDRDRSKSLVVDKEAVYTTKVYEVLADDRLEIVMPMEKMKLILLPVGSDYDLYFITSSGFYQCYGQVIDRYKEKNTYLLLVELTSNLRKHQRREFYRFSCSLAMESYVINETESTLIEDEVLGLSPSLPLRRSVVIDISGGGMRFVANYSYKPGMLIECRYGLVIDGNYKEYKLAGKVLDVRESDVRPGVFEHRVQYIDINSAEREEIIRFIFEEERKSRKKERRPE
ncbi:MAG: flagellar brake protein [Lachnospiraceae bacterium]|jgi:c-di-GMP-binding flagellar brake protein YcgR|nr:flagellar brake protein [Lachnospiraceae bacterium]